MFFDFKGNIRAIEQRVRHLFTLKSVETWTFARSFTRAASRAAEGVGFEPTVGLHLRLISSQVPSTAQPPFLCEAEEHSEKVTVVEGNGERMGERANRREAMSEIRPLAVH